MPYLNGKWVTVDEYLRNATPDVKAKRAANIAARDARRGRVASQHESYNQAQIARASPEYQSRRRADLADIYQRNAPQIPQPAPASPVLSPDQARMAQTHALQRSRLAGAMGRLNAEDAQAGGMAMQQPMAPILGQALNQQAGMVSGARQARIAAIQQEANRSAINAKQAARAADLGLSPEQYQRRLDEQRAAQEAREFELSKARVPVEVAETRGRFDVNVAETEGRSRENVASTQAGVEREKVAAGERQSKADRASREKIAQMASQAKAPADNTREQNVKLASSIIDTLGTMDPMDQNMPLLITSLRRVLDAVLKEEKPATGRRTVSRDDPAGLY